MTTPTPVPSPAQAARVLLKQLQADFEVFRQAKPLAIGIDKQLIARLPDVNRKVLRIALGMHTNSLRYLKAMEKATGRFNLEGQVDGEVTETQRKANTINQRISIASSSLGHEGRMGYVYPSSLATPCEDSTAVAVDAAST